MIFNFQFSTFNFQLSIFNFQFSTFNFQLSSAMPMFYTPKPRQFHYRPRFYDPEKEEWEKLKTKYRLEKGLPLSDQPVQPEKNDVSDHTAQTGQPDLEYFQRRVKELDRRDRAERQKMSLADLFRKREKPQFHYVSRFDDQGNLIDTPAEATKDNAVKRRIQRRFEEDDDDRLKPVPAGKIMIYTLLVCLLLYFIFM